MSKDAKFFSIPCVKVSDTLFMDIKIISEASTSISYQDECIDLKLIKSQLTGIARVITYKAKLNTNSFKPKVDP